MDFPFPPGSRYTVQAIWGSAPNDYWIAGGHGLSSNTIERMLFHWNGSLWSAVGPFGTEDYNVSPGFSSIWGAASNDVYAVARTALYHYDGNTWTPVSAVSGGTQVFGSSGSDVYVINGTALSHWNGAAWSTKTMPSAQFYGWANSPTDVWMSSLHYDGTFFVTLETTTSGPFVGSTSNMYSFDVTVAGARVIEWTGGVDGTVQTQPSYLAPKSAWRTPDGHIFVAGSNSLSGGLLVH